MFPQLGPLQQGQLLWVGAALTYNFWSYVHDRVFGQPIAPTNPVFGLLIVALIGIVVSIGALGGEIIDRWISSIICLFLLYFGVWTHIQAYLHNHTLPGYESTITWSLAVLVNSYGVGIFALSAVLSFMRRT